MPNYTVETVCNEALDMIGYKRHIGSIYDGTPAARVALSCYAQTRDELLVGLQPHWSLFEAVLVAQGTPDFPWQFSYTWPTAPAYALHILTLRNFDPVQQLDPRPIRFRALIFSPTSRLIFTNLASGTSFYVGQVLDPSAWEPDFRMALIMTLANKFKPMLEEAAEKPSESRRPVQPSA